MVAHLAIDATEAIDVAGQDCQRRPLPVTQRQGLIQTVEEQRTVRQIGQMVVQHVVDTLCLGQAQCPFGAGGTGCVPDRTHDTVDAQIIRSDAVSHIGTQQFDHFRG